MSQSDQYKGCCQEEKGAQCLWLLERQKLTYISSTRCLTECVQGSLDAGALWRKDPPTALHQGSSHALSDSFVRELVVQHEKQRCCNRYGRRCDGIHQKYHHDVRTIISRECRRVVVRKHVHGQKLCNTDNRGKHPPPRRENLYSETKSRR